MIGVLAACSYITITFMVEAMAIGNAFLRHKKKTKTVQSDTSPLMRRCHFIPLATLLSSSF